MHDFLSGIKMFVFDLDGTLYSGEQSIEGAIETTDYLRRRFKIAFLTNSSVKMEDEIHEKLGRLGFTSKSNEIYASSSATIRYMKENSIDNVYLLGSESFRRGIEAVSIRIMNDDSAENVVVGLDQNLDYKKVATAMSILGRGGKFIACNQDASFPTGDGRRMPGCAAMVAAVSGATGRMPDFIVGKPGTYMLAQIAKIYDLRPNEIVVVGDSYSSDIAMAIEFRSKGILIAENGVASASKDLAVLAKLNHIKQILGA